MNYLDDFQSIVTEYRFLYTKVFLELKERLKAGGLLMRQVELHFRFLHEIENKVIKFLQLVLCGEVGIGGRLSEWSVNGCSLKTEVLNLGNAGIDVT